MILGNKRFIYRYMEDKGPVCNPNCNVYVTTSRQRWIIELCDLLLSHVCARVLRSVSIHSHSVRETWFIIIKTSNIKIKLYVLCGMTWRCQKQTASWYIQVEWLVSLKLVLSTISLGSVCDVLLGRLCVHCVLNFICFAVCCDELYWTAITRSVSVVDTASSCLPHPRRLVRKTGTMSYVDYVTIGSVYQCCGLFFHSKNETNYTIFLNRRIIISISNILTIPYLTKTRSEKRKYKNITTFFILY